MDARERIVERLTAHSDLRERLALVPPSARLRGVYYLAIESALASAKCLDRYRRLYSETYSPLRWYSFRAYLTHLAVAGALLASPERVNEGMYDIGRLYALSVAESLLGRTMLRLLSRDPRRVLEQGMAGKRQTHPTSRWELAFPTDRSAIVTMKDEYAWIESNLLGAAQGTFQAIGISARIVCELDDPYNGRHLITW